MSLLAGSLAFTAATLLSRIFGLARDVTLAAVYGASVALDAYMISIIFPFFLRKIFGEGAMGSSFIPYYKTSKNRNEFTSSVINTFLLITFIIVLLVEIFPSFVPYIFSMGYETSGKETIERLVRITAFFIPEVFLWAIFYSILNSHGKYFLPALTPLFMNLGVIIGTWIGKDPTWSAMGFVIGGGSATLILGIEAAKYKVDHNPSYEWGGEDNKGNYVFDEKRPGWKHGPIHDILVENNVTAVFYGHGHFYSKQDLDGIVYQECPQPGQTKYHYGHKANGGYKKGNGIYLPNSGHLKVSVNQDFVKVDYVRSWLPGDGNNGEITYSYLIT